MMCFFTVIRFILAPSVAKCGRGQIYKVVFQNQVERFALIPHTTAVGSFLVACSMQFEMSITYSFGRVT